MGQVVLRGGAAGALIGLVLSQLLGLAVIGTDDIPSFADREDLPALYVVAAVIGVVAGFVVGVAGLGVGRGVADATSGKPARRRLRGALAAGATAAALSLFTVSPLLSGRWLIVLAALAIAGGLASWLLLPGVVDLDAAPAPRRDPGTTDGTAAAVAPTSPGQRVLVTVAGAALGAFVGVQVVMTLLGGLTSLSRGTSDAVAFVVLGLLFLVIGAALWRATGSRAPKSSA